MKKLRRKVISIFLVTLMIFSSTITAFAASTDYTYKLSKREYTFGYINGNPNKVAEHVPKFTAKNSKGKTLKEGKDYVLDRPNSWETKLPGIYKIYYQFIGNYTGFASTEYKVKPRATNISGVSTKKKGFTVKWKKKSDLGDVSGYQIQYSTSSKFKNAKTVKVGKSSASKTISNLKAKKKYYVRMRTYYNYCTHTYVRCMKKTYTYKGTVYSSWSKAKIVKTK